MRSNHRDIRFIESKGHYLYFKTSNGNITMRGTMYSLEQELEKDGYARCNNSFLVNLSFVTKVTANSCIVDGTSLSISRSKRNLFMQKLTLHLGGRIL